MCTFPNKPQQTLTLNLVPNNPQPFLFLHHHHPPQHPHPFHCLTTLPTATTTHYHHWLPTTNSAHTPTTMATMWQLQMTKSTQERTHPLMAMWQCHITCPNDHQNCHRWQRMPKNEHEWPHHSQMMASTYEQTQATTCWGQPAHFPPPTFL